jgi:hypothetical protein
MTVCPRCNSRLTFIGQLYCPLDNKQETFHRMIYIYACLKSKCKDNPESVRVFRCQLSKSNKYFSERPPNYDLLDYSDSALASTQKEVVNAINFEEKQFTLACEVEAESKKLSSIYLLVTEDEPSKLTKKIFKKLSALEYGQANNEDYDSDDSCVMSQSDKELLDKYKDDDESVLGKYYSYFSHLMCFLYLCLNNHI